MVTVGTERIDAAQYQVPMRSIVARAQALDLRAFEIAGAEQIITELQPPTSVLLSEARTVLGSVLECCASMGSGDVNTHDAAHEANTAGLSFELAIDATVAQKLGSHQAIEEIAFIAQLELRQRADRLERMMPAQGSAALLGECDSSLRRMRKALTAVDAAIAQVAKVPPLLDYTSELQTSIAVRRTYAKFRAAIAADGEPAPDALHTRFRAAGTQIAKLIGRDVYSEMRVRDRLLLRELQQRILAWLRAGDDNRSAGIRLWQDLAACVEMFALVNKRQELVEHDTAVVWGILDRMGPVVSDTTVDVELCRNLFTLEGLDPELDGMLERPPPTGRHLRSVLTRIAKQFPRATTTQAPQEVQW